GERAGSEAALCQRGADAAAEVRPPLGPVEARPAEDPAAAARRGKIDAEVLEECDAAVSHLAAVIGECEVAARAQRVGEADAQLAGKMVVTGARSPHGVVKL